MMLRPLAHGLAVAAVVATAPVVAAAPASALDRPAVPITGHAWHYQAHGSLAAAARRVTMTIAADGTLTGNDGCNDFGGHAAIDPSAHTIDLHHTWQTRRACLTPDNAQVAAQVQRVLRGHLDYVTADGVLILTAASGAEAVFMR